jgi:hypothetical protein
MEGVPPKAAGEAPRNTTLRNRRSSGTVSPMKPKNNQLLKWITFAISIWAGWVVFFVDGEFDPPGDIDVAWYRIGVAVGAVADDAERSVQETNQNMQNVADGRNRLNDRRIRNSKGESEE